MPPRLPRSISRALIAGAMLLAFAVRALVPQGFMPASDGTFSLVICPEDFPAALLARASQAEQPADHEEPAEHAWHAEPMAHAEHMGHAEHVADAERGGQAAHHEHGGHDHSRADHCVFGTACSGGPLSQHPALLALASTEPEPATRNDSAFIIVRLVHLPEPRGPPAA